MLGQNINMLIADNAIEHAKGLSGTELDSLNADGMLFVFKKQQEREFWMKGMNYNLDVLWLKDGKIMKIDRNVPAPEKGEEPAKMSSWPFEIDVVIELPAGGVDKFGFVEGQTIKIDY